jgi:protein-S-isoprenylcysteine O-methyltransferase Ste14
VRKPSAAAGSALFFALAPGVVAGLIPYLLTGWEIGAEWWQPVRVLGAALVVAATVVLGLASARFVIEGLGTPAPVAPTEHLVVGGLYRYVRNVMYIAVTTAIVGQALLLGQPGLFVYAALMWAVMATFVKVYEEPTLAHRYGAQYEEYRRAVPAWWPRLSGGRPPSSSPSRRGPSRRRR